MVQRYPYEPMGDKVFTDGHMGCRFRRINLDEYFGISEALMMFFNQHGRCSRCDGPVKDWSQHEACSPSSRRSYGPGKSDIELLVPNEAYQAHWKLRVQETRWRASFNRRQRAKAATGSRTREEVRVLLDLQERRCYYCFENLEGPGGGVNAPGEPTTCHEDHYLSLKWGGGHAITNIVLACVSCNSRKSDMHGDDFSSDSLENATRATRKALMRIHQARAEHSLRLVVAEEDDGALHAPEFSPDEI